MFGKKLFPKYDINFQPYTNKGLPVIVNNQILQTLFFLYKKSLKTNKILIVRQTPKPNLIRLLKNFTVASKNFFMKPNVTFLLRKKYLLKLKKTKISLFYRTLAWIGFWKPFSKSPRAFFSKFVEVPNGFGNNISKKNLLHTTKNYRLLQQKFVKGKFLRYHNNLVHHSNFFLSEQIVLRGVSSNSRNWMVYTNTLNKQKTFLTETNFVFYNIYSQSELVNSYLYNFYCYHSTSVVKKHFPKTYYFRNFFNEISLSYGATAQTSFIRTESNVKVNFSRLNKLPITKSFNLTNFYQFNQNKIPPVLRRYFHYHLFITKNNKPCNFLSTQYLKNFFFESRLVSIRSINTNPLNFFSLIFKRKFIDIHKNSSFNLNITMWYYVSLVRFIENCSGLKTTLLFNPFIENSLSYTDIARCYLWSERVFDFRRLLGPKIFIQESFRVLHLALKLKDPAFLSSWIKEMLKRTSFWKYRVFLRYLKYVIQNLFYTIFNDIGFKGFKLKLKGKISVGGNSRTRVLFYRIGETSQSKLLNKVTHDISFVYTFTGVLGFQLWFYF